MRRLAILSALLALAACQTAPRQAPAAVLHCDNGEVVEAGYAGPIAVIRYKNKRHIMRSVLSGTGARYEGGGLQWLTKGFDEGVITPLKRNESDPDPTPANCRAGPPPP
ncbi:MAG: MliC family protein [Phenylobacterium sp.]